MGSRRFLLVVLLFASSFMIVSPVQATYATALHVAHGGPAPYQNYLADSNGNLVHLAGINYGDHPIGYPRYHTMNNQTDAQNIESDGFNAVRLVAEWGSIENSSSASVFTYNFTTLLNRVNNLTSSIDLPRPLYVIIKLHADADSTSNFNHLKAFLGPTQYCEVAGDVPNGFNTRMSNYFYQTTQVSNSSSGFAHLTNLWKQISSTFASNRYVVGYDFLNEPTRDHRSPPPNPDCAIGSVSEQSIRNSWHSQINTLVSTLRSLGDNKMDFIEEAPFFDFYGGGGVQFTPYSDSNTVASAHFYKEEYLGTGSGTVSWQACESGISYLLGFWGNNNAQGGCSGAGASTAYENITAVQAAYPNQAFDVGEYGDIFNTTSTNPPLTGRSDSPHTVNYNWIGNATNMFLNTIDAVGNFYWASGTDNYWASLLALNPMLLSIPSPMGVVEGSSNTTTLTINVPSGTVSSITFAYANAGYGVTLSFSPSSLACTSICTVIVNVTATLGASSAPMTTIIATGSQAISSVQFRINVWRAGGGCCGKLKGPGG